MFTGIDSSLCAQAWELVLPAILNASRIQVTNKFAGCMIVLDPTVNARNDLHIVYQATINGQKQDAKAQLTQKHRLPSSVIQQQYPYYELGDTKWGGSTIDAGGLIVAFSGVQAVFDEMFSEWMASAIRALARWEMTKPDGVMSEDYAFIGGGTA